MLKTFTGYKGVAAFAKLGKVEFALLAKNPAQLAALWSHIMKDTPLDESGVVKAIIVEAKLLPAKGATKSQTQPPAPKNTIDI